MLKIGNKSFKETELDIKLVPVERVNTSRTGLNYYTHFGDYREINVKLDILSEEEKDYLESLKRNGTKFEVELDNKEKFNAIMKGSLNFKKISIINGNIYSTTLTLIEVV
ncbi:hypothetical protein LN42_00630 [Marinitoga sp. 1137]|uniref:hypothetical protein n=1 Tax=Marinitoga sp. 1137 TaxID=1545835 RepID=UPI0009504FBF|nr:hypothetical protein [Marinitoga sp. 1137]APT75064.1 hypothetical protein LN42_00630 [Marinitoga sp. 1137]